MTKADIVENILKRVDLPKEEVVKIVESVFGIIKETLQHEGEIVISGFGHFITRNKKARRGRDPQTGSDIELAPRRVLTFKSSPVLKATLNPQRVNDAKMQ